jgi:hypothetical protein
MEQPFSGDQTQQPNLAKVANAYQVLANHHQTFVDNPVALTPGGAILLQEIRDMRAEMKRGFKMIDKHFDRIDGHFDRIDERFGQIKKRARAE